MNQKGKLGKILLSLSLCMAITPVITGCSSSADTLTSPNPSAAASNMPGQNTNDGLTDMLPSVSPNVSTSPNADMPVNSGNGLTTIQDSRRASEEMEDAISLLSEVDEADVVAIGNQALIGIEFEDQYQGALDDRIKGMILARVQTISKGVTEVFITDDPQKREEIDRLADLLDTSNDLNGIMEQFNALTQDIQVYQE